MNLLRVTDVYGRRCWIDAADWVKDKILLPVYTRTGRKVSTLPKGLRPDDTHIHRENIIDVEAR